MEILLTASRIIHRQSKLLTNKCKTHITKPKKAIEHSFLKKSTSMHITGSQYKIQDNVGLTLSFLLFLCKTSGNSFEEGTLHKTTLLAIIHLISQGRKQTP